MARKGSLRWPLRLLTILLHLSSALSTVSESGPLMKFRSSLSNPDLLPDWRSNTDPCNPKWGNVICKDDGHVYGLQIENMSMSGTVDVDALTPLTNFRTLSLQNNSFEGGMPEIWKIGPLRAMYLSMNRFSGEIGDGDFKGMGNLRTVHLYSNRFSGTIPSSLAAAPLVVLRLDDNEFDGEIPDMAQPGLKLNVSHNKLDGPIPDHLSLLDAAVFEGNPGLCGKPLSTPCKSSKKLPTALLAALIVLAIGAVLAIIGIAIVITRRRRQLGEPRQLGGNHSSNPKKVSASYDADSLEQGASAGYVRGGSGKKASSAATADQGRLVFVRETEERFELQDLLRASAEVLGSGSFGSSYKAVLLSGPSKVVKRFKEMNGVGREEFQEHMRRLGMLSHPNLLSLLAYYYRKEEKLLVSEYIPNGSLAHLLHANRDSSRPALDWPARLKIVKGVARGLSYLYDVFPMLTLPHGNLKSSNVLLDDPFEPLLTDYSLAPVVNQPHASHVMVAYKSPEFTHYGRVTRKSDVWSLGILILEVLTGRFPANNLRPSGSSHRSSSHGGGTDLAGWVNSVVREEWTGEVFDEGLAAEGGRGRGKGEMLKLLQIGMGCCEVDVERRWELRVAVNKIEELREEGESEDDYSSYVSEGEVYSSSRGPH
ncbi:putative LRR receptor-like serine/threonine-protein kinase RLK [Acorus calamus]|uniref:LRR receptor-like serine/threonine-protein kinase RLK n=1 Tax=Acorus calamus TaxID=4465 RepID=A0AAV9FD25_ACOCL|nr:putative LRR receptor-like serine/threonine-protein kinase RLK [Acorus calamus]